MRTPILRRGITVAASVCIALPCEAQTREYPESEPRRFALVIGNTEYAKLGRLPSATVDAQAIMQKLRYLNFEIDSVQSLASVADFETRVLPAFRQKIGEGDIALVYYSGHGFAYASHNWLAPLDMPDSSTDDGVADRAVALENIGTYLSRQRPGLMVFLVDACRAITNLFVDNGKGENQVSRGVAPHGQFGPGVGGKIGYAARVGDTAMASSVPGQLSIFTKGLVKYVDAEGRNFDEMFDDVIALVGQESKDSQIPELSKSSPAQLFLRPTNAELLEQQRLWEAAERACDPWGTVDLYARKYAVSRYGKAARMWLADHEEPQGAECQTALSPAAVDKAWNQSSSGITLTPGIVGLSFSRSFDAKNAPAVATLSNAELGFISRVALTDKAKMAANISSITAHEEVVAERTLIARANPAEASKAVYRLSRGTRVTVLNAETAAAPAGWLAANVGSDDSLVYLQVHRSPNAQPPVRLGKALVQFIVPSSRVGVRGAVERAVIDSALQALHGQNKQITWMSLSTAATGDSIEADFRKLMLVGARDALKRGGIDGERITAVSSSADYKGAGVRVRVFGWEP